MSSQRDEISHEIREASGEVDGDSNFQCFLYLLIRDHVPPGKVASTLRQVQEGKDTEWTYSNGWLAKYAEYVEDQLTND
jgi:hypothetical protein